MTFVSVERVTTILTEFEREGEGEMQEQVIASFTRLNVLCNVDDTLTCLTVCLFLVVNVVCFTEHTIFAFTKFRTSRHNSIRRF